MLIVLSRSSRSRAAVVGQSLSSLFVGWMLALVAVFAAVSPL
jgi:hypothetical protein